MKNIMKRLLPLCLAMLVLCQAMLLTACDDEASGDPIPYTITIRTEGGMALKDIEVFVYADSSLEDLVWAGKTDENGVMSFEAPESADYVATLKGVTDGYAVETSYPLAGAETVISLKAQMATDVDLSTITVKKGDVMFDFSITDTAGTTHQLSELLKKKQAVVLNFWYTNCGPCKMEFPYLQQAYDTYSEKIEVLALNPVDTDTAKVTEFKDQLKLTFPVAAVESDWERVFDLQGYPTTIVIDRYGVVSLIHTGMLDSAAAFEEIFSHYADANYVQGEVDDVTDLTPSATGNKLEFGGVEQFDVKVPADTQIPVDLYKVTNMILEIKSPNVYVVYDGKTYTPENGVLSLPISAPDTFSNVSLMIGNSSNKEETFHATLSIPKGDMGNPYAMSLGEFTASVAADNNQGVFYTYTAEKSGELKLKCLEATAGINYDFTLYNLTTYVMKNYESDGTKDSDGKPILSIEVRKGDQVQFSASSLPDEENKYPAATFKFKASFTEKNVTVNTQGKGTDYTITVKDNNGKPVPGATFSVLVNGATKQLSTNASGVASFNLEGKSYVFILTVPKGYTAAGSTTCKLTSDKPAAAIVLNKTVVKNVTYTVTVKDTAGKAVSGATVVVGNLFATTDASGKVSLTLPGGNYDAIVSPPAGYATPATVTMTMDKPSATITLQAGNSGSDSTADKTYTVTIKDAAGKAQSGIMVKFVAKDGSVAAVAPTNASGVATAALKAADYTVEPVFSGTALGYDKNAAVLSASKPAITVLVAQGVTGDSVEICGVFAEPVRLGGTYVELHTAATKESPNYFVFTPTQTGKYQFTTTSPKAIIRNWGANPQFINDSTTYTAEGSNTFVVNIKDLGEAYNQLLGIYGADECIVLITRLGDAELGWEDKPYETYQTTAKLTKFTKPSGKVTYVDVTKKHTAVLGSDGFYHLDSANGPKLYVNLGAGAPHLPEGIADVAENGGMKDYLRDSNGNITKKIEFNSCIFQYYGYTDNSTGKWVEGYTDDGFYPLTADLLYILQTHTSAYGWNDASSKNYLFTGKTVDISTAWMFCVCTFG